jgi:hypothetical protein
MTKSYRLFGLIPLGLSFSARRLAPLFALSLLCFLALIRAAAAADAAAQVDLFGIISLLGGSAMPALLVIAVVSFLASIVVALTPTPNPTTRLGRVYQVIEWLAMVTRGTKETGFPVIDELHAAQLAVLAAGKVITPTEVSPDKASAPVAATPAAPAAPQS